ncbi:MAG: eL32 family ribosomal protein [Candidatus Bilamarchaeaceae archaeon]
MVTKKNKPKFNVLNSGFKRRVKHSWRKPRGIDNKKRIRKRHTGASPRIGYGTPAALKDVHPSGLREITIQNPSELEGKSNVVVRIASGVGAKTREAILAVAGKLKLRILNKGKPREMKPKEAKAEKKETAKPAPKNEEKK